MTNSHKVALITGITGQDGSYLTELLLDKGAKLIPSDKVRITAGMNKYADRYASLLEHAQRGGNKEIYDLLKEGGAI